MARRQTTVTVEGTPNLPVTDPGYNRDTGRTYVITEMPAAQAEDWAFRALFALLNAGASVPDATTGMAGLAAAGMDALGKIPYDLAKPLLAEMFTCVMYQHKPGQPTMDPEPYIEEVATRFTLRKAIFMLHTGFSKAGGTLTTG